MFAPSPARQSYVPQVTTAMVVDDDKFMLATIKLRLAKKGIEVVTFETITEARVYIATAKIDFAILDLGLPDGDGMELLSDIRNSDINRDIPIIIATARQDDKTLIDALKKGGAMLVSQKPIDWACLDFVLDSTVLEN